MKLKSNEIQFSHWLWPVMFKTMNSRTQGSLIFVETMKIGANKLCTFTVIHRFIINFNDYFLIKKLCPVLSTIYYHVFNLCFQFYSFWLEYVFYHIQSEFCSLMSQQKKYMTNKIILYNFSRQSHIHSDKS